MAAKVRFDWNGRPLLLPNVLLDRSRDLEGAEFFYWVLVFKGFVHRAFSGLYVTINVMLASFLCLVSSSGA